MIRDELAFEMFKIFVHQDDDSPITAGEKVEWAYDFADRFLQEASECFRRECSYFTDYLTFRRSPDEFRLSHEAFHHDELAADLKKKQIKNT